MRPVFLSEDVEIVNTPRIVGMNHIILSLKQNGCDKVFDSIGFNMADCMETIGSCSSLDIVYTIDKTVRDGRTFPQFKLKDIKAKENN